jgi:hypothetical protein
MPAGTGAQNAAARGGPQPPSARPTWLVVLSSMTLVYGGLMLVSGLTVLRDPMVAVRMPVGQSTTADPVKRQLAEAGAPVIVRHQGAIRTRAGASLVLGLLMLYAAAATLSRDRHGRTATLTAAWLGILYQVGTLPLVIPIAREYAAEVAPLVAPMVAAEAAKSTGADAGAQPETATAPVAAPTDPESVARGLQSVFVGLAVAMALAGVFASLLLIAYFGGRRGQALYGLGPAPPPR